uniref:Dishevelled-binding antagonist of beta-catenin 3a n=1 Tax=Myripristis murdjan TaxID=586833 RepID=A0A667X910_9TELE
MSLQEPTGTFGVLFPAFSLPMKAERSRNKERLEASLAGLCELELLKQRQECRVLSALCLGDSPAPGRPAWGALRPVRCATDAPNGGASDDYGDCGLRLQTVSSALLESILKWHSKLAGVNDIRHCKSFQANLDGGSVTTEHIFPSTYHWDPHTVEDTGDTLVANQDGSSESGYQPMASRSFPAACSKGTVETETGETWVFDPKRGAEAEDILGEMKDVDPTVEDYQQAQRAETYMFGLIQRRALPPRPSKPRTSLAHDARAITVARQSSLCRKEDQHSPKQVSVQGITELPISPQSLEGPPPQACHSLDQERYLGTVFIEDSPPPYHHLQQSTQHQSGLYHRPRQPCLVNNPRSTSVDYPSCRVLQAHPDSSNSEPDSPQHFHSYPSPPPLSMSHQLPPPDEQLVNAEYIPAHPCRASTRTSSHHQSSSMRGSGGPKPSRSTYSPESGHQHQESRGGPKKCRLNEERGGASRKPGKKACRSQSENSLQRVPERKYNTVERDGGGSGSGGGGSRSSQSRAKKQQQGSGGYRRWRSTQELSQDEGDQPPTQAPVRTRKSRPTHTSYAYLHHNHHHSHHHQHIEYQLERDQVPLCQPSEDYPHPGQGESESSMSEADSPDTSSLSSDSDESGGLVWPQQLPPQLSLPSPPAPPGAPLQPKAFVKIKASHALKKKILRFRTGSLKVMTTV